MEFFQTGMGKKFFEGSVPKLIRAIERLADSVDSLDAKLAKQDASQSEEKLSIDLGDGVILTATKKGSKDDYPGFWIDIEVGGESYPLASVEKTPQVTTDEKEFSIAVWSKPRVDDPEHIIKSGYTFADVVNGELQIKED